MTGGFSWEALKAINGDVPGGRSSSTCSKRRSPRS